MKETAIFNKKLVEGVLLSSAGVILIVIGIVSKVPLTMFFALGLGAFIFYVVIEKFRSEKSLETNQPYKEDGERKKDFYSRNTSDDYFEEIQPLRAVEKKENKKVISSAEYKQTTTVIQQTEQQMTNEPKDEFNGMLLNVLQIIKEVTFAHTVSFFLVNHENNLLIAEAKITDSSSFVTERKITIGNDIVSQIALSGEPKIVNQITSDSEKEIVRYYTSLQDVKSFIGSPVFYSERKTNELPIGVIAVDSKAEDAFGEETYAQLAHFSNLLASLLASYTEKFDLQSDSLLLRVIAELRKRIAGSISLAGYVNAFLDAVEQIISWDSLSVTLYDETQGKWSIAAVRVRGNFPFVAAKQLVDIEKSIVGNCIRTSSVFTTNDASKNTLPVFYENEPKSELLHSGSLTVLPFVSGGKNYGALTVTSHKKNSYSKREVAALEHLTLHIAPALEILELNTIISEHVLIDEQTGVLTKKHFLLRLADELSRANDREEDLSLLLISLSNLQDVEQRYGIEGKNAALQSVASLLRTNVRSYDIIGRFDNTTFGVALCDTTASDTVLWAEKLRSAIVSHIITAAKKTFSVAVTIGVSGAGKDAKPEELIKNASYILEQAKKAGGNIVRVY